MWLEVLVNNQLNSQFFPGTFISTLYMFPAVMCPSSGELLHQCDTWFMTISCYCVHATPAH